MVLLLVVKMLIAIGITKILGCLITQHGCDSNGKIPFVRTDRPGATNGITCFRETSLCK
jgi:hypothetical protein